MKPPSGKQQKLVQVKLPLDIIKAIDILAVEEDTFRGPVMERLLRLALAEMPLSEGS